jgi:BirA family transcriptional regulator, biotin operon repressor / biotin---[acetyl-CoA-carboxylase] ligase
MTRAGPAAPVLRLGRVDSTQAVAFGLAAEGAGDRTVVVADSQAAGRGRRGRVWLDEPGASLLLSVVLRPRLEPTRLPLLSLAAAVAVAETLGEVFHLAPRLKWPNDVLVADRKIAGILLESRLGPAPLVVLGIGVNLTQRTFPPALTGRATSVALETDRRVDRETLLGALLEALDRQRADLERGALADVLERWRALSDTLGRTVIVDDVRGVATDIDDGGALVVADDDGRRHLVVAGEVGEVTR